MQDWTAIELQCRILGKWNYAIGKLTNFVFLCAQLRVTLWLDDFKFEPYDS